jgi:uncharacterized protein with gpF-like domain
VAKAINAYSNIKESQNRLDSPEGELVLEIEKIKWQYKEEFEDDKIFNVLALVFAASIFSTLSKEVIQQVESYLKYYIGKEMGITLPNETGAYLHFSTEMRDKLKKYLDTYFSKLDKIIGDYFNGKKTLGQLVKTVDDLNRYIAKTVPEFLSRDMVGTMVALMTGQIANILGITTYLWETADDEKVRGKPDGKYPKKLPSHWAMQGLLCKFSDSTVYSTNGTEWKPRTNIMPLLAPGEDYNCRCIAAMNINPLLSKVDKELQNGNI